MSDARCVTRVAKQYTIFESEMERRERESKVASEEFA